MEKANKMKCKVLVCGAGPAGSAAACTLARNNIDVIIVDKYLFPRNKLCGGLITQRSNILVKEIFNEQLDVDRAIKENFVEFLYDGKRLCNIKSDDNFFFVYRSEFDEKLLNAAKRYGAKYVHADIVDIDLSKKVAISKDGAKIVFDYVIGADGVKSVIAKKVFGYKFRKKQYAITLEIDHFKALIDKKIYIDFGGADWGYGWVFPKYDGFTIGIGGLYKYNKDIKDKMKSFIINNFKRDINEYKIQGYYLPFGKYRKVITNDFAILCGDAAGLVDPITGEGIGNALMSGRLAAEDIIKAINENMKLGSYYNKEIEKIIKEINRAKIWRYLIFPKIIKNYFMWAFSDASTMQKGYLDILSGKKRYKDLPNIFYKQLIKAVKKGIRKILR